MVIDYISQLLLSAGSAPVPVANNISLQEKFALVKSKIKCKVSQQPGSAADTMQTIPLPEDEFVATS